MHGGFGMKWRTRVGQRVESLVDEGKPVLRGKRCGMKLVEMGNRAEKGGPPGGGSFRSVGSGEQIDGWEDLGQ